MRRMGGGRCEEAGVRRMGGGRCEEGGVEGGVRREV